MVAGVSKKTSATLSNGKLQKTRRHNVPGVFLLEEQYSVVRVFFFYTVNRVQTLQTCPPPLRNFSTRPQRRVASFATAYPCPLVPFRSTCSVRPSTGSSGSTRSDVPFVSACRVLTNTMYVRCSVPPLARLLRNRLQSSIAVCRRREQHTIADGTAADTSKVNNDILVRPCKRLAFRTLNNNKTNSLPPLP